MDFKIIFLSLTIVAESNFEHQRSENFRNFDQFNENLERFGENFELFLEFIFHMDIHIFYNMHYSQFHSEFDFQYLS